MMLRNKIALVLGGTGSIGSAISDILEKEGALVCRHGLSGDYAANLSDSEETARLVKSIIEKYGGADVLVNSVSAPAKPAPFDKKSWADFLFHLNIQLKASVEVSRLVLPKMKEQGWGRIVNVVTSYTRGIPPSSLSDYITAKYAVLGLTRALASDLGKYGVTVNAVSPSFVRNRFTAHIPEKFVEMVIERSPEKRLVTPEEIARKVLEIILNNTMSGENVFITAGTEN